MIAFVTNYRKDLMKKNTIIAALVLYFASTALSYGVFSYMGGSGSTLTPQQQTAEEEESSLLSLLLEIDPSEPQDQACPLNGKLYTTTEKNAWEKKRPLAVMIENTPDSRPQSGLTNADLVFEAIAEGGVTRFMAFFYCGAQKYDVLLAPIRSARTYFVDWASGFNKPLYVHVGGANVPGPTDALGQISDYGWNGENDLNQFSIGYPTFVRNYNRIEGKEIATEHTMETSTERLWAVGEERGWTNMSPELGSGKYKIPASNWQDGYQGWSFIDQLPAAGNVTNISYEFWSGYDDYAVKWEYLPDTNTYRRFLAGQSHTDLNNDKQVEASNVVVLLSKEKGPLNEKKHMMYDTTGTGKALVFRNGEVIEATWLKKDRESELTFNDEKGKKLEFVRGMIWISVVDVSTEVTY